MKWGLKGGISIYADSWPPRYVLWCCGGICHKVLTFIQIGCGHTVTESLVLSWFNFFCWYFSHEPLSSINLREVCYWNINDMTHPWRFEDDKTRTVRSELEREFFVKLPPRLSFKLMKKTNKICCGTLFGDNQFLREKILPLSMIW